MKNIIFAYLFFSVGFVTNALGYPTPPNLDSDCQQFLITIDSEFNFGWISVPEIPSANELISVFFYYRKTAALKNPVIFFNGGPGYTSHSSLDYLEKARMKFGGSTGLDIDFIYMDQRGTGCSTHFPNGASQQTIEKLKWYGSAGIVNDAEYIRKYLIGDRKWKVFGQSFGSHVVHRYLEMHPESILSAHGHGFPEGHSDFDFSFSRIAAEGTVLKSYLKQNPNDEARFKALKSVLADPKKCFLKSASQQICGYEISEPLLNLLDFRDQWSALHVWLMFIVPTNVVNESNLSEYIQKFVTTSSSYHDTPNINESYLSQVNVSLNFIGLTDWNSTPMDADKCALIYKKIEAVYKIKEQNILFDLCKAPTQFNYNDQLAAALRLRMQVSDVNFIKLDDLKANLSKYKVPFYLYSGSLDSAVPKDLFQTEAKALGSLVKYTNFPDSGHDGFYKENQVLLDLVK